MSRMTLKKIFASLALLMTCSLPMVALAEVTPYDPTTTDYNKYSKVSTGTQTDLGIIAKNLIGVVMGFLGLIAVIFIIMAGFQWMTAGGDEKKLEKAKDKLIQGAIGLVIIIASWSIANFLIATIGGTLGT